MPFNTHMELKYMSLLAFSLMSAFSQYAHVQSCELVMRYVRSLYVRVPRSICMKVATTMASTTTTQLSFRVVLLSSHTAK